MFVGYCPSIRGTNQVPVQMYKVYLYNTFTLSFNKEVISIMKASPQWLH